MKSGLYQILFIFIVSAASMLPAHANRHDGGGSIIVDVNWLEQHLSDEEMLIVDTRDEKYYLEGHVPGAINIPVKTTFNPDYDKDRVGKLPHIRKIFSSAGLTRRSMIVLYDDSSYIDAGRLFWVLELFGHTRVKLLNGGMPAWVHGATRSVSTERTVLPRTVYTPTIDPDRLVTRNGMKLAIDDPTKVIIDARKQEEYTGKKTIAKRAGHIPQAVNIPWQKAFIEQDGLVMLKGDDELRLLYDQVVADRQVYTYCNKGKQASLTYTILRQLGHEAAHYVGSWSEWGNDLSLPVISGKDVNRKEVR